MSKKPLLPTRDPSGAILRLLTGLQRGNGRWVSQIFSDWVHLVRATLLMTPAHVEAVETTGRLAVDDAETKRLFDDARKEYEEDGITVMAQCMAILLTQARSDYDDVLGEIYMAIRSTGQGQMLGQFFTPFELSKAMAIMICSDIPERVIARLREAGAAAGMSPADIEVLAAGPEGSPRWEALVKAAEQHITPITVGEPCCGSGGMVLAVADQIPRWMHRAGLVVFHLNDLDRFCVAMAHVNLLVHGLTGVLTYGDALMADFTYFGSSPAQLDRRTRRQDAAA